MHLEFLDDAEQEDFEMLTKPIELTRNESLFIDDNITLMTEDRHMIGTLRNILPSAVIPVPLDFVEKIGMAILMTADTPTESYTVELNIGELLTIRELCTSYIKIGEESVGWNLKLKVFKAMLQDEYQERKAFETLVGDIPFPSWDMEEVKKTKKESSE